MKASTRVNFYYLTAIVLCGCAIVKQPVALDTARLTSEVSLLTIVSDPAPSNPEDAPDRLSAGQELSILRQILTDTYPHLSPALRSVARGTTFVIDHHHKPLTKFAFGWSAEDDPDYHYPDRNLYHPKRNPRGTIKVNFTERFLKALELGLKLGNEDPRAMAGLQGFYRSVVAHELTHSLQYQTAPVKDFSRFPDAIKDGLPNEAVLKDAQQKVEYERRAFATGKLYENKNDLLSLANTAAVFEQANPQLFEPNGAYRLLSQNGPAGTSFANRMKSEAKFMDAAGGFPDSVRIGYESEVVPPAVVLELKKLNDRLAANPTEAEKKKEAAEAIRLQKQWDEYMAGPLREKATIQNPYLAPVAQRYDRELARFQKLMHDN